ncbi:phosphodiesterase [Nakamurella sp. YIM 132087]|uniref:Phosphodiesterase n=1 Tax=Nakamurella alba TaxID=2665158 RepID=A0A7K1FT65_9ACTN|nr:metallophosphoesterase [Nakamurella alba]MTD17311.1 phosphodiesterase [Nakamurella alba]
MTDLRTPDGEPAELPVLTVAHLSDTHLTSAGTLYNNVVDADLALDRAAAVLEQAAADGRPIDVVVVSGDLTDTGDPDAYRRLRSRLEGIAPQIIWATGNHDVRAEFHRSLLGRTEDGPVLQVVRLPQLRIVVLDSTIVGAGHGRLEPGHLAELTAELAEPHPGGSVVVLHHAPLPPPSPLLTYFALERESRRALAAALAGTDVRLVLAGHHHLAGSGMLGTVPVAVAGSTAIRTDPLARPGHERTTRSGSFNLVRFYDDGHTVSVIPVDGAEQVFDLDPAAAAAVIDAHPVNQVG